MTHWKTTCCDQIPIPESLELYKSGMHGRCPRCRQFGLLDDSTEPEQSPADLQEEREARLGDYLREKDL